MPGELPIHWLTTAPNPLAITSTTTDQGQRGWKRHAVRATPDATLADVRRTPALCGLRPRHGWGYDLFIDDQCERCEKAAGLAPSPATVARQRIRAHLRAPLTDPAHA